MRLEAAFKKNHVLLFLLPTAIISLFLFIYLGTAPFYHEKSATPKTTAEVRLISRQISKYCMSLDANCWEEKVEKELLANYSINQVLIALYDFDQYFSCHAFTHFVGRTLYRQTRSIADSYAQIDFTCHGGTYHGVIEAYLDEKKIKISQLSGQKLRAICEDSQRLTNKNPNQVYTECLHGFGHAFMFITDSDLLESLKFCDRLLTHGEEERCYGGAFMENSTSSTNSDHPTKWLKKDDKFYPCNILADHYQRQCYYYQANYLIKLTIHNYPSVFAHCDGLLTSNRYQCILGLGANLAGFSRQAGISGAAKICSLGRNDAKNICVEGAIRSLMARYGGNIDNVLKFCRYVEDSFKNGCLSELAYVASGWGLGYQKIETICKESGIHYLSCLNDSQKI